MRNHTTTAARADIGRTTQLCQDALIEMLKELFAGKIFCGQEGRKALKIYKQDLPIPQSDDADVDTDKAEAPYIVVRMTGGQIEDDDSPQTVDFSLIVCAYDTGLDREGWQDVANIKEDIIQRVCKPPLLWRRVYRFEADHLGVAGGRHAPLLLWSVYPDLHGTCHDAG